MSSFLSSDPSLLVSTRLKFFFIRPVASVEVIFPSLFLSMALSHLGTLVMEAGGFCWFWAGQKKGSKPAVNSSTLSNFMGKLF